MIIYHNPRCSKSRQTLALLREHGIEPEIVEYLKTPLASLQIKDIMEKLGESSSQIIRVKEALFKDLGLKGRSLSSGEMCEILESHPKLLERPIVVSGSRAVIGRPPENVLALITS